MFAAEGIVIFCRNQQRLLLFSEIMRAKMKKIFSILMD